MSAAMPVARGSVSKTRARWAGSSACARGGRTAANARARHRDAGREPSPLEEPLARHRHEERHAEALRDAEEHALGDEERRERLVRQGGADEAHDAQAAASADAQLETVAVTKPTCDEAKGVGAEVGEALDEVERRRRLVETALEVFKKDAEEEAVAESRRA